MNIAIIGYGKMGHVIEKIAKSKGIDVVSTIDPEHIDAQHKEITKESLEEVDVCIDFTAPSVVVENIKKIAELKKNVVVGTTGWYDKIDEVKEIVQNNGIGLIYASNFSIGVHVFFRIIENAAKIMNKIEDYDVFGLEFHHNKKVDSPSGTAKTIADILIKNIGRKKKLAYDLVDREINKEELHFASVRAGSIPGTHEVGFDSEADTIELKHTARNREGFALGAVLATQFINGKKGFFTVDDMMKNILGGS
jgi:4-hydroxy-tetrahydrodipicolinate reductase